MHPRDRYWDGIGQDIRYALRQLLRRPALPAAIVILLALGIGANTAFFSVVKAILLDPLPFESPEQLAMIWETDTRFPMVPVSGPNFLDWRELSRTFGGIAAFTPYPVNLTGGDEPERVLGALISPNLFDLLRVRPELGREFLPEEEEPGRSQVAIISGELWRRRFGADPDMLGEPVTLDGRTYILVGIMPAGFQEPNPWRSGRRTDVWTPLSLPILSEDGRDGHQFLVLGRLGEGVALEAAQEEMNAIARRLEEQYPDSNTDCGARIAPLHEQMVGSVSTQVVMLFGAAGLVLLIVCGNVAALLMSKGATREAEFAIRSALGASRPRLIRQLLTESLLLSLLGAGLAALLSSWSVEALQSVIPSSIPRADRIAVDGGVLAFTLGLSILTAILFGLAPALAASGTDLTESLKQGRASLGLGRSRLRTLLVVSQFALTIMLANGAALMLRSYWLLQAGEFGFSTRNVLTARLSLKGPEYADQERVRAFFEETLERLRALPGVRHVAATSKLPLEGGTNTAVLIEGQQAETAGGNGPLVEVSVVTKGYFDAMGIPLFAGRTLAERDSSPARPGVVINRTMARQLWPDQDPIGKRFSFDPPNWRTVVGVVADVRQWGLERPPIPEVYVPYHPSPPSGMHSFDRVRFLVLRTDSDPMGLATLVRREVLSIDRNQPVSDIRTADQIVAGSLASRRFSTLLTGLFATMALLLVAAGIYGVMSYAVSQRTREIGVRMALGASRTDVLKLVLGQGLRLTAIGAAIGLAGVVASIRLTASMLYGISPTDPVTVACGTLFIIGIGLLSALVPAGRATRIAPVAALRQE